MKLEVVSTLKDGLHFLKENPKILVPLTASVVLWLLVTVVSYGILELEYYDTAELLNALILLLLVWTVTGTLGYFLDNAAIRVAADIALSGETHLKNALLFTLRKLLVLLAAGFIYMLIVTPASLLIVPGIYLGVRLFFFSYAVLIDNESAIGSLKKSWSIVKGNWLRMFALLAVFAVIGFPLGYLLEIENLLLWTVACAGMMFVRGWAIASLTLAYLQLASEPEEEVEERSTRPEESLELQQKPKPKPEIEKRPVKGEEVLKQKRGDFSLSKEISPEDEIESEESTTMEIGKELEEEKSSGYVGFAEQTLKTQVNVVTTSTAEKEVNGVKIEGLGLRRKRARKSGIEHETDKNESRKENEEERAEEESRENTKDDESSLDGISIILRRD